MTQESTTAMKNIELGKLDSRDVYSDDGRLVGVLKGILVDTAAWTVPQLVVEVNKKALDDLNLKKPMLSTYVNVNAPHVKSFMDELKLQKPGTVLVNVPTTHVKSISDVVQLSADLASVSSVITIAEKK
jgi:sporulation protein YlmC with PRC-barrel domain